MGNPIDCPLDPMEQCDKIAYSVLKTNYTLLATDLDARRISAKAAERGLLSSQEKKLVWHSVARDGVSAGTERFLDILLQKRQEGVFQQFVELLGDHADLKFWADCLRGT